MYTTPKKLADRTTEQIANGTCAPDEALLVTVWFRADADENWDLTADQWDRLAKELNPNDHDRLSQVQGDLIDLLSGTRTSARGSSTSTDTRTAAIGGRATCEDACPHCGSCHIHPYKSEDTHAGR